MRIKDLPPSLRPREKAMLHGLSALSDAELLALIIGRGTVGSNALEVAYLLLAEFQGLSKLREASVKALTAIRGVSSVKAIEIAAAFEISARADSSFGELGESPIDAEKVFVRYRELGQRGRQEILLILMLDRRQRIIREKTMYVGTSKGLVSSEKEIITALLTNYSARFFLIHNHPSGVYLPSEGDVQETLSLAAAAQKLGLIMVDHVIIGAEGYYSFSDSGLL